MLKKCRHNKIELLLFDWNLDKIVPLNLELTFPFTQASDKTEK